jgi:catechol 2,3-dioxygenase-like lactoylglutathione lyase family enzyme
MASAHKVRWMYHTTAMVADYVRSRDWLIDFCDLRVLEDAEVRTPGVNRRGGMVWLGDNSLELGQPLGTDDPTARFVQRFGSGMHSVALQVQDIEATIAHVEARGVRVGARPLPFFILCDPRTTEGIFLEFNDHENEADPLAGAAVPPAIRPARLDVRQMAFAGAVAPEPRRVAERLADVIGTEVTFTREGAGPGEPEAGVSLGSCTLALYRLPEPGQSVGLWGKELTRAQVHLMAFTVPDLEQAAKTLSEHGVRLIRRDAEILVPDPAQTGDIPVAFTEKLLPNDPRGTADG